MRLRQASHDILYFKDDLSECDFLLRKNEKVVSAFKVCWKLTEENLPREFSGFKNAMKVSGAKKGIIITCDQQDIFDGIVAIPLWKWMQQDLPFQK